MTELVQFSSLDEATQQLILSSLEVRKRAYCPYSKFSVGCTLRCKDGRTYSGVNVENGSYGLTVCAERSAISSAVTAGSLELDTVAVSAEMGDTFVSPCGACRQAISEFGSDITIYLAKPALGLVLRTTIDYLLPLRFELKKK